MIGTEKHVRYRTNEKTWKRIDDLIETGTTLATKAAVGSKTSESLEYIRASARDRIFSIEGNITLSAQWF